MDIIHGLSNLEIETTPSTSQEVEEEEVKRNWLELPLDVMSLILLKLGTIDILGSAQWVCTSWWKLSKQPHLFRSISMQQYWVPFSHNVPSIEKTSDGSYSPVCVNNRKTTRMVEMTREAVDRSCGQLAEISLMHFANDELLHCISQKSESLRCLRLVYCYEVTDVGLTEVCQQFPQLEELAFCGCFFSDGVIETVGCLCPHLKSFRLNYTVYPRTYMLDRTALVISETMLELCNLHLFGDRLTDVGLRAILHGCPHLQSLDLRECINIKFEGDLMLMTAKIKLRLPYDSIDDFEYAIQPNFDDDDDFDYDVDEEDDWYND